jgi:hypothetical protein
MSRFFRSRRILSVAPIGLVLLSGPCEKRVAACRPTLTVVFVDQSASSVVDSATRAMFQDTLSGLADNVVGCKGDAIHGFLVHAKTRGKVSRVDVVNTIQPPATEGKPKLSRAKEANKFRRDTSELAKDARERVRSLLDARVEPRFKSATDMLGTLEVISDEVASADSTATVRIYYLGDMYESMPAPRRNFDRQPPRSVAEAEQWADADTTVLNQMRITRERFKNAEVRVLLGNLANKPGMPHVRRYWERVFQNAGFDPDAIDFN